ncbi:hypothetical protein LEMLEM_LOCUS22742 [Lemmus lemmus]
MSGRLFHEAGTLKDHPTLFWQVQQSFSCGSCMFSLHRILSNSPGLCDKPEHEPRSC